MEKADYSQITEAPGTNVTPEQVLRLYQRYFFALPYCEGKQRVAEIACGGGCGLGLMAQVAQEVVALDIEPKNIAQVRSVYGENPKIKIIEGDALHLPFGNAEVDTIILFEAIYYFPDADKFLEECRRVLKPAGHLLIGSANRQWKDFNPSAFSTRYYSAAELRELLERHGFRAELFQGFPIEDDSSPKARVLSLAKRTAVKLHLIPKSMKYKKFLKRIFVGKLVPLPPRLTEGIVEYIPPLPLDPKKSDGQFKVIYAVGLAP